jgi:prepilin-type processing-associated H-X9-DG protein
VDGRDATCGDPITPQTAVGLGRLPRRRGIAVTALTSGQTGRDCHCATHAPSKQRSTHQETAPADSMGAFADGHVRPHTTCQAPLHCMTESRAAGGAALGTCGLSEPKLRKLCVEAGFAIHERVVEVRLDVVYGAHP